MFAEKCSYVEVEFGFIILRVALVKRHSSLLAALKYNAQKIENIITRESTQGSLSEDIKIAHSKIGELQTSV
jgi:hypothetical protein